MAIQLSKLILIIIQHPFVILEILFSAAGSYINPLVKQQADTWYIFGLLNSLRILLCFVGLATDDWNCFSNTMCNAIATFRYLLLSFSSCLSVPILVNSVSSFLLICILLFLCNWIWSLKAYECCCRCEICINNEARENLISIYCSGR